MYTQKGSIYNGSFLCCISHFAKFASDCSLVDNWLIIKDIWHRRRYYFPLLYWHNANAEWNLNIEGILLQIILRFNESGMTSALLTGRNHLHSLLKMYFTTILVLCTAIRWNTTKHVLLDTAFYWNDQITMVFIYYLQ